MRDRCAPCPARRYGFSSLLLGTLFLSGAVPGVAQWNWVELPALPRHGYSAYDAQRQRVVLVCIPARYDATPAQTWEWDGTAWLRRDPSHAPSRPGPVAYDLARQRLVMVGGASRNETWEWDGFDWLRRSPPTTLPIDGGTMAYDAARRRVVLHFDNVAVQQTWEWDGTDWTHVAHAPLPRRSGAAMAYDAARQRIVLVGGSASPPEAWEWDGTQWMSLPAPPGAWTGGSMAYDDRRQRLVLFGGRAGSLFDPDTYEFDGTTWTRFPGGPTPVQWPTMAFDAGRGRVVSFGGSFLLSSDLQFEVETWERSGTTWTRVSTQPTPPSRPHHTFTYHGASDRFVAFGNLYGTWTWDRRSWQKLAVAQPSERTGHAVAYDERRQRLVLFGGGSPPRNDTWEWDGSRWWPITTASPPPARTGHGLAYDAARQVVVLFGGVAGGSTLLRDTWTFDGTNWIQRSSPAAPAARAQHVMVCDSLRQRVVLFGGGSYTDTWEWDGTSWTLATPSVSPSSTGAAAFDPELREVVMYGGWRGSDCIDEIWSWNGVRWARRTGAVPARFQHEMAYDPVRRHLVVDGGLAGTAGTIRRDDTGLLTLHPVAATLAFGAGCAGARAVPRLSGLGRPAVGGADFALDVDRAAANAPLAIVLSLRPVVIALPGGCTAYVDPALSVVSALATSGNGGARLPMSIPLALALRGLILSTQAGMLDATHPLGIALTQGLAVRLGN